MTTFQKSIDWIQSKNRNDTYNWKIKFSKDCYLFSMPEIPKSLKMGEETFLGSNESPKSYEGNET